MSCEEIRKGMKRCLISTEGSIIHTIEDSAALPHRDFFFRNGEINTQLHSESLFEPSSILFIRNKATSTGSPRQNSTVSDMRNDDEVDNKSTEKDKMQLAARTGSKAMTKGAHSISGMVQKYGRTFVGAYASVYFITLGTLFGGIDSGIIDPSTLSNIEVPWHIADDGSLGPTDKDDFDSGVQYVASLLKKFKWSEPYADTVVKNPHLANLAIAWIATKLTEPIRFALSLAIVRSIKKESPPPKEE
mmetsp:Transcript_11569/g.16877  ORF Transcript_11569/g.16877 Transcript_11569/m.16877 type:complete len:246 (+) Transcript_11569:405-1142(+)